MSSRLLREDEVRFPVGTRMGKLTVVGVPFSVRQRNELWVCIVCECDCGKVKVLAISRLLSKPVKSCGCGRKRPKTHGWSRTRLHNLWCGIKHRTVGKCASSELANKYYVLRGITICDEWKESFESFRDWSLSNGYRDDLEIDRIDSSKGYSPENCRWATRQQQMRNIGVRKRKRKNSRFKGVARCTKSMVNPWRATISVNGKPLHLGVYRTEEEAAEAYDVAAKRHYGEFASLNNA